MDIDEKIYRSNGFRILGLDITSKNNKIKNRLSKVDAYRNRKNYDDSKPLEGVFDKSNINLLLPVDPSPSYIDFQNAKNRLNNVRIRLIDEILWFWPKSLDIALEQEVVDYLKDKNYDGAISYWNTQSMTDSLNTTSIHNLAILHHSKSLDLFINENSSEFLNDLELGLNYWADTLNSNNFKNFVKKRVNSLNDPRLTEDYVDTLFKELPYDLLNINLILIKKMLNTYEVSNQQVNQINNTIKIIQYSSFSEDIITNINSKILEYIDSLIKKYKDSFESDFTYSSDEKLKELFELRENLFPLFSILKTSYNGNSVSENIRNNNCLFILNKMITLLDLEQSGINNINIVLNDETKINQAQDILNLIVDYSISEDIQSKAESLYTIITLNGVLQDLDTSQNEVQIENSFKELGIPYIDKPDNNVNNDEFEAGVIYLANFIKLVGWILILSFAYFVYCTWM